jgi:hypothetical protein
MPVQAGAGLPVLGLPTLTWAQAVTAYQGRDAGEYTSGDVRSILADYCRFGCSVGVDPLVSIAQLTLETAWLTSWWAARPRRNPAGIGVTGAPGAGVSFPTWQHAVRAHVGRLAAYAIPVGAGTPEQEELITEALKWRALPDANRGRVHTMADLAGRWAADPLYGDSLARVANVILAS